MGIFWYIDILRMLAYILKFLMHLKCHEESLQLLKLGSEIPKDYKPTLKYVYIYLIIYQCHDEMKRLLG